MSIRDRLAHLERVLRPRPEGPCPGSHKYVLVTRHNGATPNEPGRPAKVQLCPLCGEPLLRSVVIVEKIRRATNEEKHEA